MNMKQFITEQVIPKKPYERPGSHKFINAAKSGDYEVVCKMLKNNKYFVYDFDDINQTALHWAAKRNYKNVVDILIEYGANVNCTDMVRFPTSNIIGWKNCFVSSNKRKSL